MGFLRTTWLLLLLLDMEMSKLERAFSIKWNVYRVYQLYAQWLPQMQLCMPSIIFLSSLVVIQEVKAFFTVQN